MGAGNSSTQSHPDITAARIEAIRIRAEADVRRIDAEAKNAALTAEAHQRRIDAEARNAALTAEAHQRRIDAEAKNAALTAETARFTSVFSVAWLPLVAFSVGATLAVDFYLHESHGHLRRKMMRALRSCRLPPSVRLAALRLPLLPVPGPPLWAHSLPTMILGPTGCGKSTMLASLARNLVNAPIPVPVAVVRLRLPSARSSSGPDKPTEANTALDGELLMDSAVVQICDSLGLPRRRALALHVFARGFSFLGSDTKINLTSGSRLKWILETLFAVAEEVHCERLASGIAKQHAAPLLIFDEAQDLIKDSRLKKAGGEVIFHLLGTLIVRHCVDSKLVKFIVAGSSAEIDFAFDEHTPAGGNRWNYHDAVDPTEETLLAALQVCGYTVEEARSMVATCGTRLRLLEGPLVFGAAVVPSDEFCKRALVSGTSNITSSMMRLDVAGRRELAEVLDQLTLVADNDDRSTPLLLDRPTKMMLSPTLRGVDLARVLYVTRTGALFFQSHLHRQVWKLHRGDIMRNAQISPLLLRK